MKPRQNLSRRNQRRDKTAALLLKKGLKQKQAGNHLAALETFRSVLRVTPDHFIAMFESALALQSLGRDREAIEIYGCAQSIRSEVPELYLNVGNAYRNCGQAEKAIESFSRALSLRPDYQSALMNMALAQKDAGHNGKARVILQKLVNQQPGHLGANRALYRIAKAECDFLAAERHLQNSFAALELQLPSATNYDILGTTAYDQLFNPAPQPLFKALTDRIGQLLTATARPLKLPSRPLDPDRKIHIGYLSPNFGNHPVGQVTRSLFGAHDRKSFEISGYSVKDRSGEATDFHDTLRSSFDNYVDFFGLQPIEAARKIAEDEVDLLVDLDGYMDQSSPRIMAYRPSPIQVFWLGHAGGLGLPFIDYLIADNIVLPDKDKDLYSEAIVRLPETYHPYHRYTIPEKTPTRAEEGLSEDGIVFCAFNNSEKINLPIFRCWMRLLREIPNSQLWLTDHRKHGDPRPNIRSWAKQEGVEPGRLVFARFVHEKGEHLARHRLADLFLDTITVNAATTALDALWAGLPVLTCTGDRFASRMAASFLSALDMPELICDSLDQYTQTARTLARDPGARVKLREKLNRHRLSSPLFDTERFTRHLEEAYRAMWRQHCAGGRALDVDIPAVANRARVDARV